MRIGSLFSGAGGLDMGVENLFGGEVIWQSEYDKAASKVLAYRFPCAPNFGDITQIDWKTVETPDVLCGGFPCQDVSAAGKRAGIKDGTRSGLWALFADAIDALRPPIVIIENVRGLLSAQAHRTVELTDATLGNGSGGPVLRAAGAVLGDLADLGYDAQWTTFAAGDIGAPHRRERVFILATDTESFRRSIRDTENKWQTHREVNTSPNDCWPSSQYIGHRDRYGAPYASNADLLPTPTASQGRNETSGRQEGSEHHSGTTLHDVVFKGEIGSLLPTPRSSDCFGAGLHGDGGMDLRTTVTLLPTPKTTDLKGTDSQSDHNRNSPNLSAITFHTAQWGKYEPAIRRWENLTRPAPAPTEPNKNGNPRLSAAFSEWLMGWPDGWVTDPDIGISRNDQLKIVGNGVCPQQAAAALRYLLSVTEVAA